MYLKNRESLQNFKNHAGDKLKLPLRECPAGIGRIGISDCKMLENLVSQSWK